MRLSLYSMAAEEGVAPLSAADNQLSAIVSDQAYHQNNDNCAHELDNMLDLVQDGELGLIALTDANQAINSATAMTAAEADSVLAEVEALKNSLGIQTESFSRESYRETPLRMAMEGIGSTISSIFTAIANAFRKVWEWIKGLFNKLLGRAAVGAAACAASAIVAKKEEDVDKKIAEASSNPTIGKAMAVVENQAEKVAQDAPTASRDPAKVSEEIQRIAQMNGKELSKRAEETLNEMTKKLSVIYRHAPDKLFPLLAVSAAKKKGYAPMHAGIQSVLQVADHWANQQIPYIIEATKKKVSLMEQLKSAFDKAVNREDGGSPVNLDGLFSHVEQMIGFLDAKQTDNKEVPEGTIEYMTDIFTGVRMVVLVPNKEAIGNDVDKFRHAAGHTRVSVVTDSFDDNHEDSFMVLVKDDLAKYLRELKEVFAGLEKINISQLESEMKGKIAEMENLAKSAKEGNHAQLSIAHQVQQEFGMVNKLSLAALVHLCTSVASMATQLQAYLKLCVSTKKSYNNVKLKIVSVLEDVVVV